MSRIAYALAAIAVIGTLAAFIGTQSNVASVRNLHSLEQTEMIDLFNQWKLVHDKTYATASEEQLRFTRFVDNFNFIQKWNADITHTSTVGLNLFADLNTAEFKALRGCLNMPQMTEEVVETTPESHHAWERKLQNLPASVDWRAKGAVTPIKNQGQCGSCWSFSTTGSLEGLNFITNGNLLSFSEQQIIDCSSAYGNQGCDGGWPFWALQYTQKYGVELESQYPYKAVDTKCTYNAADVKFNNTGGFLNVTKNNEIALATAVVGAPTSICIEADQPVFQLYTGGVITSNSCGTQLDHAVLAVGYDTSSKGEEYWIVKNSWGASWGLQGYVYIGKSNSTNTVGVCGIAMNPTNPQM
jgi:C1A family cysteine protease